LNPVYKIVAVRTVQMSALGVLAHWALHWPFTGPHALGLFLTPALCVYFVFVFAGTWTWGLPVLTRLPDSRNAVALTFDDGPSAETTPRVLDALRSANARATFFVLGEAVDRRPDLLRRIVAEGHAVGIHAYSHEPFVLKNRRAVSEEIQQAEAAVRRACPNAKLIPWVRPPHGFKSLTLLWTLRRAGWGLAAWSLDSRDYRAHDPAQIAARVFAANAGAIVLLHDGPNNAPTAAALKTVLHGLAERGLATAPLPNWVSSS
jgi:peptidoglycan/xylan/chitin deacetylase (PgdA/CDA1 family)